MCFPGNPFIVAEVGDYDELIKNIMEDASPFPYDLSEEEFDDEVSYLLEEKPYPEDYWNLSFMTQLVSDIWAFL